MAKLIGMVVVLSVCATALVDSATPVAYVCRFYSNGEKGCQKKCAAASNADTDKLIKARPASNDIPQKQIDDIKIDPLLSYKCSDSPVTSKWDIKSKQDFAVTFTDTLKDVPKNKKTYLGSCAFDNDKAKGWNCRGLSIDTSAGKTYIGAQTHSDNLRGIKGKPSWKVTGNDDVQFIDN
ncbi:uncharacterized protein LOC129589929 [Paramacrobiotus metropolitanus]|uniref:uncharacterized protein LOC129589929 n=1 Tax=Paramacrobiotus metropolitanus TaxID=2943436 RepID=UPI002445FB66|nr:uncharacterized protein LOC129589929 [Paramacrobiotus metropolitanus]